MYNSILLNSCKKLQQDGLINNENYEKCQIILNEPNETWSDNDVAKDEYDILLEKIDNGEITDYKGELEKIQQNKDFSFSYDEVDKKIQEVQKLEEKLDKNRDQTLFIVKKKMIADNNFTIAKYNLVLYTIFIAIVILIIIYYNIRK